MNNCKKILFITSEYLPSPDANGLCVSCVAEALNEQGYQCFVICERKDGQKDFEMAGNQVIYRVTETYYSRLRKRSGNSAKLSDSCLLKLFTFLRKIKSVICLPFFPSVSLVRERRIYRLASKLIEEEKIDCVVGVFRPFDGIGAACKLKAKYPALKTVAYFLDLLHCAKPTFISKKAYQRLCRQRLLPVFRKLDLVILPTSGKEEFEKAFYDSVRKKLHYAEFPLVRNMQYKPRAMFSHEKGEINIVYAGTISKQMRDPSYLLQLIAEVRKENENVFLHMFGACDDTKLREACKAQAGVFYHGEVESETAYAAIEESDAVVNISNQAAQMVPSKIFELFSFGKPIINIVKRKKDHALPYMESYPLVCNIFEYENALPQDGKKLQRFLKEMLKQERIEFETIERLYEKCTPRYMSNLLTSLQRDENEKNS